MTARAYQGLGKYRYLEGLKTHLKGAFLGCPCIGSILGPPTYGSYRFNEGMDLLRTAIVIMTSCSSPHTTFLDALLSRRE